MYNKQTYSFEWASLALKLILNEEKACYMIHKIMIKPLSWDNL